jgi:hypothetical protein
MFKLLIKILKNVVAVVFSVCKLNIHLRIESHVMVFNSTFNNISVISWWSALLVEETGVPGENHR